MNDEAMKLGAMMIDAMVEKALQTPGFEFSRERSLAEWRVAILKLINEQTDDVVKLALYKVMSDTFSTMATEMNNLYKNSVKTMLEKGLGGLDK